VIFWMPFGGIDRPRPYELSALLRLIGENPLPSSCPTRLPMIDESAFATVVGLSVMSSLFVTVLFAIPSVPIAGRMPPALDVMFTGIVRSAVNVKART
jgi:hypothetical protein